MKWPDKDPEAEKDYAIDWSAILQVGETIDVSTWTPDDASLTAFDGSITDGVCTTWLSGGNAGQTYLVTNHITTSRGMIDERTVQIKVRDL
jgi:hypothetical protein